MTAKRSVGRRAKAGIVYATLGRASVVVAGFVATVILARLLEVRDFGVAQLCFLVVGFAATLGGFGFSTALVQREQDITPAQINTLFAIDLAVKCSLALGLFFARFWIADYFHEPELQRLVPVIALYIVFECFAAPAKALLARELNFAPIAKIEFSARIVEMIAAIAMAVAGWGVWSLILGKIGGSAVGTLMACFIARWAPNLRFDVRGSRELLGFGSWLFVRNLAHYLVNNVDYWVIGRFLGAREVGLYSKAFELIRLPQGQISRAINSVLFSAFSRLQSDRSKVSRGLQRAVLVASLFAYPALSGLGMVAPEFVLLVFGEKWLPMTVPLQIMCLAGIVHTVDPFMVSVLTALGYVKLAVFRRSTEVFVLAVAVVIGVQFGVVGVAIAIVCVALLMILMMIVLMRRVGLSAPRDYLAPQLPALGATLVMAGVLWALRQWSELQSWPALPRLLTLIAAGIFSYALTLGITRPRRVRALLQEGVADINSIRAKIARRLKRSQS